jgi:hypothetical protein
MNEHLKFAFYVIGAILLVVGLALALSVVAYLLISAGVGIVEALLPVFGTGVTIGIMAALGVITLIVVISVLHWLSIGRH